MQSCTKLSTRSVIISNNSEANYVPALSPCRSGVSWHLIHFFFTPWILRLSAHLSLSLLSWVENNKSLGVKIQLRGQNINFLHYQHVKLHVSICRWMQKQCTHPWLQYLYLMWNIFFMRNVFHCDIFFSLKIFFSLSHWRKNFFFTFSQMGKKKQFWKKWANWQNFPPALKSETQQRKQVRSEVRPAQTLSNYKREKIEIRGKTLTNLSTCSVSERSSACKMFSVAT